VKNTKAETFLCCLVNRSRAFHCFNQMSLLEGNDAIRTVMTSPGRSGARALSVVSSTTSTQQAHDKHTTSTRQAHNKHTTSTRQAHDKHTTSTRQAHNKHTTSTHWVSSSSRLFCFSATCSCKELCKDAGSILKKSLASRMLTPHYITDGRRYSFAFSMNWCSHPGKSATIKWRTGGVDRFCFEKNWALEER